MVNIDIKNSYLVLRYGILLGPSEEMHSLSGGLRWMDCQYWMLPTPVMNTLYVGKNWGLAKANSKRMECDASEWNTPEDNCSQLETIGAGPIEHWEPECKYVLITPVVWQLNPRDHKWSLDDLKIYAWSYSPAFTRISILDVPSRCVYISLRSPLLNLSNNGSTKSDTKCK